MRIRFRLPAPPPAFEGRRSELARLATLAESSPLALIVGLGGLGKTSLALSFLHGGRPANEPVLFVAIRPGETASELLPHAASALARSLGIAEDYETSDPELALTILVDLAETHHAWIVLDGLESFSEREAKNVLVTLNAHVRNARVIATSRVDPALPELAGRVLALGPLDDVSLARVVSACRPDFDAASVGRVVARAAGSPWRARHLAGGARVADDDDVLGGVDPAGIELVETLYALAQPVSLEGLAEWDGGLEATARALERRSIVEIGTGGVALNGNSRELLRARMTPERIRAASLRAIGLLERSEDAEDAVELARLFLSLDERERALEVSEQWLERCLAGGFAQSLFRVLSSTGDPRFLSAQLACVKAIGGGRAVAWAASLRRPDDPACRIAWASALRLRGQNERALEELRSLPAGLDPDLALEAALAEASTLFYLGRAVESAAAAESAVPTNDDGRARRLAAMARALVTVGDMDRVARLIDDVERLLPSLSPSARREARAFALVSLGQAGHTRAALRLAGDYSTRDALVGLPTIVREALALVAHDAGQLDAADLVVESLERIAVKSPLGLFVVRFLRVQLCFARGAFDRARSLLDILASEAERIREPSAVGWARWLLACWSVHVPADTRELPAAIEPEDGLAFRLVHATDRIRRARAGEPSRAALLPSMIPVVRIYDLRAEAEEELARGETLAAIRALERARLVAVDHGRRLDEAELLVVLAEAHLLAGSTDAVLREIALELATLASSFPSARFEAEAEWIAIAASAETAGERVEALAARATDSPAASRRAALLLGAAEGLDERDRVVVARAKEAIARRRPPEPRGTLVLSAKTRRAVLPNGREADLAQSDVGFRLLRALAESGGVVSKEDLVRKVWAVRDYHPLRDDKRLHVSILRLRERLLAEGCGELVLTAEGGYSVACPATVVD